MSGYAEWRERKLAAQRLAAKTLYRTRRDIAVSLYGGKCSECGSQDEPSLNIVPDIGVRWGVSKTGKPISGGSNKLAWLDRNDFPPGFRLLCRGACPTIES